LVWFLFVATGEVASTFKLIPVEMSPEVTVTQALHQISQHVAACKAEI
jgi:hypothetical protein